MRRVNAVLISALLQSGFATAKTYQVKRRDTLSAIAKQHVGKPIWGKKGSLKKILLLNPDIKNPDSIQVDQVVILEPEPLEPPIAEAPPKPEPQIAETTKEAEATGDQVSSAPVVENASSETDPSTSGFEAGMRGMLSTTELSVEAVDGTFRSSPMSKINQGVELSAAYRWNDTSKLELRIGLLHSQFADSKDGLLTGNDKVLKQFGAVYHHRVMDRLSLSLGIESEQVFFLGRRAAGQKLQIEPIFVDAVELGLSYDLYLKGDWRWTLGAAVAYDREAEGVYADPRTGANGKGISIVAYRLMPSFDLEGTWVYEKRSQDTTIAKQSNEDYGIKIGIFYRQ